jgi:uncharacterized SAM-binding protein YcdF (DUF218 family)
MEGAPAGLVEKGPEYSRLRPPRRFAPGAARRSAIFTGHARLHTRMRRMSPAYRRQHRNLRLRDPDIWHTLGVAVTGCVLSGGLLYFAYVARVWHMARTAPILAPGDSPVLLLGKAVPAGGPDPEFRNRILRVHQLLRDNRARQLLLLGGGPPGDTEAEHALRELGRLGLPEGISPHLEQRSRDTLENLRNARELLGNAGCRVVLVSSRHHLARSVHLARGLGFEAVPCAAEERLPWNARSVARLLGEGAYLCWLDIGCRWARLIRHRRMLARVS